MNGVGLRVVFSPLPSGKQASPIVDWFIHGFQKVNEVKQVNLKARSRGAIFVQGKSSYDFYKQ